MATTTSPSKAELEKHTNVMRVGETTVAQQQNITETSAHALAMREQAMIQAMYTVAISRPRKWAEVERKLLEQCAIPSFADGAKWARIVGKKKNEQTGKKEDEWGEGFSIRFAESAATAMGNIYISSDVSGESEDYRIMRSIAMDIENNVVWVTPDVVSKTVDRSEVYDSQVILSQRRNGKGQAVYTIKADDASLRQKQNAALARTNRQNILKMLPQNIKEACEDQIEATLKGQSKEAALERIIRGFDRLKVTLADLQAYLGHSFNEITDEEVKNLRGLWTVMKDGEQSWEELVRMKKEAAITVVAEKEEANKAVADLPIANKQESPRQEQPKQDSPKQEVKSTDKPEQAPLLQEEPHGPQIDIHKELSKEQWEKLQKVLRKVHKITDRAGLDKWMEGFSGDAKALRDWIDEQKMPS